VTPQGLFLLRIVLFGSILLHLVERILDLNLDGPADLLIQLHELVALIRRRTGAHQLEEIVCDGIPEIIAQGYEVPIAGKGKVALVEVVFVA